MNRRLTKWRVALLILAAAVISAGVFFLIEARRIERRVQKHSETLALDMAVDLSETGITSVPFKQTWQTCHGQSITLRLADETEVGHSAESLLQSLVFDWKITDTRGRVVEENSFSGSSHQDLKLKEGKIDLVGFYPIELGDYTFTIDVVSSAPALQDQPHRLVSEYRPCGLELMPAAISRFLGGVASVIGGAIVLSILGGMIFGSSRPAGVANAGKDLMP